mgnify:CR=1 FL=1
MRFLNLNKYESRQISIAISNGKFQKWMGRYISSKDFYKFKLIIQEEKIKIGDLHKKFENMLNESIDINYSNHSCRTKLSYTLLLYNFLKKNKKTKDLHNFLPYDDFEILKSSLKKNNISIVNQDIFKKFISRIQNKDTHNKSINLFAPICPDYETNIDKYGNERYTFNGLGKGVGLVGRKFLESLPDLINSFGEANLEIIPTILLGDFENNQSTLNRLNISSDEFINSLKSSQKIFRKNYNLKAELFADYFGGLNSWHKRINNLKNDFSFSNLKSLKNQFPNIDHQKVFASRIPLYKRWYGESNLMTKSFINQIYEYILMGNIISGYHKPSIILSSDHKAMSPYYATSFFSVPVLSLNNFY